MYVTLDNVWASPSTLHARVTVHDDQGRWRHKYYPAVHLAEIPVEAVAPLIGFFAETGNDELQLELFEL